MATMSDTPLSAESENTVFNDATTMRTRTLNESATSSFLQPILVKSMNTAQQLTDNRRNFDDILIQEVKQHNLLWDSSMWEYKDIEKRREAWLEIASNLSSTVENCKRRWEQLRGCFTKTKAKQMRDGAPPTWKFYEPLLFLTDFIVPKSYALPSMDLSSSGLLHHNDNTFYINNESSHNFPTGPATSSHDYMPPSIESENDMEEELLVDQQELPSSNPSNRSQTSYPHPTKVRRLNSHVNNSPMNSMFIPNTTPPVTPFNSLVQESAQNWPLLFSAAVSAASGNRSCNPQGNNSCTEEETEDTLFGRSIGKTLQRYPQNIKTQLKIDILEAFRRVDESLESSGLPATVANSFNLSTCPINQSIRPSPSHVNHFGASLTPSHNSQSVDIKRSTSNGTVYNMNENIPRSTN